jgi:hypothetical protein
MSTPAASTPSLPAPILALGYAGLLPFAAATLGSVLLDAEPRALSLRALVAYAAVILSFLGAVHWGLLLRAAGGEAVRACVVGVLPALVGWIALLLPARQALPLLLAGFGAFWLYEHRIAGERLLPRGYLDLRRILTLLVCSLLAVATLFSGA